MNLCFKSSFAVGLLKEKRNSWVFFLPCLRVLSDSLQKQRNAEFTLDTNKILNIYNI